MSVFVRRLSRHIPIVEAYHGFVIGRPVAPEGFVFLTDDNGVYLTDGNGAFLVVPE